MPEPDPAVRPELADVGALLRARTKNAGGQELGTFSDSTRPTDESVEELIDQAYSLVVSRLGEIPDELQDLAKSAVSLRTAMLVELSYWPEATRDEDSIYARLQTLYSETMAALTDSLSDQAAGAERRTASVPITSPTLAADPLAAVDYYDELLP